MAGLQKFTSAAVAVGVPVAILYGSEARWWRLGLIAALLVAGGRLIPGFWRSLTLGVAGGAAAGLLVLGPGFRVAMRVVAVMDPLRPPEFTPGGTIFVILIGGILGALLGIGLVLLRRAWEISETTGVVLAAAAGTGLLLLNTDLRLELLELGAGAGLNVPMFALGWGLHALAAGRIIGRLERRRAGSPVDPVAV